MTPEQMAKTASVALIDGRILVKKRYSVILLPSNRQVIFVDWLFKEGPEYQKPLAIRLHTWPRPMMFGGVSPEDQELIRAFSDLLKCEETRCCPVSCPLLLECRARETPPNTACSAFSCDTDPTSSGSTSNPGNP